MSKTRKTRGKATVHGSDRITTGHSGENLFSIIFNELATSRVRHRALLEVLVANGTLKIADYIQSYEQIEASDLHALIEMMLLPHAEFQERFATWIADNRQKYGFARQTNVSEISFEHVPAPAIAADAHNAAAPQLGHRPVAKRVRRKNNA